MISKREEEEARQAGGLRVTTHSFVRAAGQGDGKERVLRRHSLWRDLLAGQDVWLEPHEVQKLGLVDRMREAEAPRLEGVGTPVEQLAQERAGSPDVRPASGGEGTFVPGEDFWRDGAAEVAKAGTSVQGPAPGAVVEATVGGGQTADGWRWWVVDGETVAYDNRPQVDAYWSEATGATGVAVKPADWRALPPDLHQGVLPLGLLSFVFDPDNGVLMSQSVDDARLRQQRADVAQVWSLVDALARDDDDPWGSGYRQALIDVKAQIFARFGRPEADPRVRNGVCQSCGSEDETPGEPCTNEACPSHG